MIISIYSLLILLPSFSIVEKNENFNNFLIDLKFGNKYVFGRYVHVLGYPPSLVKTYSSISDTITINNKKYFYMNNYIGKYKNSWIRQDNITGNIYKLNLNDSCTFSVGETLLDSFKVEIGDSVFVCNQYLKKCTGKTIVSYLNDTLKKIDFNYTFSNPPFAYTDNWVFHEKIGITRLFGSSGGGGSGGFGSTDLLGCVIDGVLYGDTSTTNISQINEISSDYILKQNFPNPFNPVTNITFSLREKSNVNLSVFDNLGRVVTILVNTNLSAGTYNFLFNGENLPSGIYYYKLESENFKDIKKMVLIK